MPIKKSRKTADVKSVLKFANYQLQRTDEHASRDYKRAICDMIETVLHETGNYSGFGFIDNKNSELGSLGYYSRFYYHPYSFKQEPQSIV